MAKKDKQGNWLDAKGTPVPEKYVPIMDKKRDAMVESVFKKVEKLSDQMAKCKVEVVKALDKYLDELAKDNRIKEGWKGNILLANFAGDQVIERNSSDLIAFDEKLQMVKTQVDKWISERMKDADSDLAKVISQAFNVDKRGRVNTAMLLKLLHLDIEDPMWKKAMTLLKESIIVKSTKTALIFRRKVLTDSGETWQNIILNFNDIAVTLEVEDAAQ